MLTPDEIAALREYSLLLTQPVNDFLLKDIARRVAKAGQLTSTAEYQMCRAQFLGADMPKLKENIETLVSEAGLQIDNLFKFVESKSLDFAENRQLQQITAAYLKASKKDLETLLKTKNIGFVAPDGHVYPLQNAYLKTMDYAVRQVITGAADYNTAIRQATKRLADSGIRTLPQKNGRNIGIEYAVRRYVMNNISAVATNINEANHDAMGADGWELSAHAASAPDHEPFQGQQFTDKEYSELNNSLVRRIGTLSCKHIAYPIILGISRPAHSEAELKRYVKENADGITYQGQHYTLYQAEQIQRGIENEIRHQKNKSLIAKNLGDKESLQSAQIKLNILKEEYNRFSSAAGLRTSSARMQVPGFDRSAAARASWMYKNQHVFYADTVKNKTARIISSIREDNKYVKYNKLPEDYRKRFEIGLENTLPSVQNLIKKALKDTRFCRIQKTSFFRRSSNSIFINTNSDVSSLAHEIFHKLDTGLSEKYRLEACLKADYEKILIENKDVFQYLTKTFSQILDYDMIGDVSFKLEYRGLSDIFAGLSNNQILLGPHHSEEYWQRKNALGAEAWAQFGRMCYNNNDGLKTLKQIFPTFYKTANIILKELE